MSREPGVETTALGRAGRFVLAILAIGYLAGGLYVLGQGLVSVLASSSEVLHQVLHDHALIGRVFVRTAERAADASHHLPSWPRITLDFVVSTVNLGLAGLLLWLRPRDRTAQLLALAMVGAAGVFNLTAQQVLEFLPLTGAEAAAQAAAHGVAGLAYIFALLSFPDGRLIPRWSRPRLVALYLPMVIATVVISTKVTGSQRSGVVLVIFGLSVAVAGVVSQAYRIRTAETAKAQAQARLLFWALLPALGVGVAFFAIVGISPTTSALAGRPVTADLPTGVFNAFQVVFLAIPIALFTGIVHYRLWDIERIVNRTAVYALATTFLGGIYVAFVVLVQLTVGSVVSTALIDSKPAVAITTLGLAATFRPIRDRVQQFVDRRFNRARYDAVVTIEAFRLELRQCVEVSAVVGRLEDALATAVGPRSVHWWIADTHQPVTQPAPAVPADAATQPAPATPADRAHAGGSIEAENLAVPLGY